MENTTFPTNFLLDIHEVVLEFMSIYKPSEPLDRQDLIFVEEVLTAIHPAFIDFQKFEMTITDTMKYFADGTINYSDEHYNPSLLSNAAYRMGQSIVLKLLMTGAYVGGFFPYVFKQLTPDHVLVFEFAPEYVGDRYWDPRSVKQYDTSMWYR